MTRKLNDADQAAVDMLFDGINTASSGNGGDSSVVPMTSGVSDANLQAIEKVLSVLSELPAPEPPADLATRTLARVAGATGRGIPTMPGTFTTDQPHA